MFNGFGWYSADSVFALEILSFDYTGHWIKVPSAARLGVLMLKFHEIYDVPEMGFL